MAWNQEQKKTVPEQRGTTCNTRTCSHPGELIHFRLFKPPAHWQSAMQRPALKSAWGAIGTVPPAFPFVCLHIAYSRVRVSNALRKFECKLEWAAQFLHSCCTLQKLKSVRQPDSEQLAASSLVLPI